MKRFFLLTILCCFLFSCAEVKEYQKNKINDA
jgi:hypothetical protein